MKRLAVALLLFAFALPGAAQPHVDGDLSLSEERLLSTLDEMGVPLPDTIRTRAFAVRGRGWWNPYQPQVVHLSPSRAVPLRFTSTSWPYLAGQERVEGRHEAHILAHEISHFLAVKMDAEMGRPALGLNAETSETQAEIMALVLQGQAFGTDGDALGYPDAVEYPTEAITTKATGDLRFKYCVILRASWDLPFDCSRPTVVSETEE